MPPRVGYDLRPAVTGVAVETVVGFVLPLVLSSLSYGTRTVPFNSPVFVKSTAALEALNNTGFNFPVD